MHLPASLRNLRASLTSLALALGCKGTTSTVYESLNLATRELSDLEKVPYRAKDIVQQVVHLPFMHLTQV